jgi:aminoglycoside phosphotransferase
VRPLEHGYTNDTRGDGAIVVKRYPGPLGGIRRITERAALTGVAGVLPVPRVIERDEPADGLVMEHVGGTHGQDLIDAGHAAAVLYSCGAMLRRLQEAFPGLVHGDYGPNNMLFQPATFAVTGILDWEWSHRPGDPVADLAWCEWIVRMHHPGETDALGQLFAGYGDRPPWPVRQAAALDKCQAMVEMLRDGDGAGGRRTWRHRIEITRSWSE